MIQIFWKDKLHYTRESSDDPLVREALELIETQKRLYGISLYSVVGMPNPHLQVTAGTGELENQSGDNPPHLK